MKVSALLWFVIGLLTFFCGLFGIFVFTFVNNLFPQTTSQIWCVPCILFIISLPILCWPYRYIQYYRDIYVCTYIIAEMYSMVFLAIYPKNGHLPYWYCCTSDPVNNEQRISTFICRSVGRTRINRWPFVEFMYVCIGISKFTVYILAVQILFVSFNTRVCV